MSPDFISTTLIPDLLDLVLFFIALFISFRAFYINNQVHNPRLFILGLSMGIIALTALADFLSGTITVITLNTDWFLFIGQTVSLLFIFLSLISMNDNYSQGLIRWHILASVFLICLFLLAPTLPPFSNIGIKTILSGSRGLISFSIFYAYISAFLKKQTRFSLLMSIAFVLLGFGYLMIVQQYFISGTTWFDNAGDIIRMFGLITLLVAIIAG